MTGHRYDDGPPAFPIRLAALALFLVALWLAVVLASRVGPQPPADAPATTTTQPVCTSSSTPAALSQACQR